MSMNVRKFQSKLVNIKREVSYDNIYQNCSSRNFINDYNQINNMQNISVDNINKKIRHKNQIIDTKKDNREKVNSRIVMNDNSKYLNKSPEPQRNRNYINYVEFKTNKNNNIYQNKNNIITNLNNKYINQQNRNKSEDIKLKDLIKKKRKKIKNKN